MQCKGKEIEALTQILNEYTAWFTNLKNVRDDFIEHHGGGGYGITFHMQKGYVLLSSSKKPKQRELEISTEELNFITGQIKNLLLSLNNYLCEHIDTLPIKIKNRKLDPTH